MNQALLKIKTWPSFTPILYALFFLSVICAFRAISSISTGLILVYSIARYGFPSIPAARSYPGTPFMIGCFAFFILQLISLSHTLHFDLALNDLRLKSGLLFLPLAVFCIGPLPADVVKKLLSSYCLILLAAALFLLSIACYRYIHQPSISQFFYYSLIQPFNYHPVYFSILVFVALIYLTDKCFSIDRLFSRGVKIGMITFFSFFLVLLSSKLVITFYLIYLLFIVIRKARAGAYRRLFSLGLIILLLSVTTTFLLTRNPVSDRFRDLIHGDPAMINQNTFTPAVYFNGIQFRLLEWKLVPEILNDTRSWWTGVSGGDAQLILNQKYIAKHMYSGAPGRVGHGYLDYNTHNQFLESLLDNGIPGLLVFIFIWLSGLYIVWREKKQSVTFIILLLLCYAFIESVFQEQYGIILFTFFPLFMVSKDTGISANFLNAKKA